MPLRFNFLQDVVHSRAGLFSFEFEAASLSIAERRQGLAGFARTRITCSISSSYKESRCRRSAARRSEGPSGGARVTIGVTYLSERFALTSQPFVTMASPQGFT